jgi:hypothetical protein
MDKMDNIKAGLDGFIENEQALFQQNERELDYFLEKFNENDNSKKKTEKRNTRVMKRGS